MNRQQRRRQQSLAKKRAKATERAAKVVADRERKRSGVDSVPILTVSDEHGHKQTIVGQYVGDAPTPAPQEQTPGGSTLEDRPSGLIVVRDPLRAP